MNNITKIFFLVIITLILSSLFSTSNIASADNNLLYEPNTNKALQETARQAGHLKEGEKKPSKSLTESIGDIIKYSLSFVGILFMALVIYGGFLWMTAGGSEEQISKGKKMIINSLVGLIIVLIAYTITYFVINQLTQIAS